jgi:hypothetical protein
MSRAGISKTAIAFQHWFELTLCATFSTVLDLNNPCLAEPRLA